jgi:hypothetical protein
VRSVVAEEDSGVCNGDQCRRKFCAFSTREVIRATMELAYLFLSARLLRGKCEREFVLKAAATIDMPTDLNERLI